MIHLNWPQLQRSPWLQRLPNSVASRILNAARPLELTAGSLIHAKGESCSGLYGLEHGSIQVGTVSAAGDELIMTRLHPGHWFGEIAVIDGGLRTHDTYTVQPSLIAWLDNNTLNQLCQSEPQYYYWLALLLCQHARASFSAIDQFLLLSPRQRLAQRILQLSQSEQNGIVPMGQEALAALVGLSRQSVSKALGHWRRQGWIKVQYGTVQVLDQRALGGELPQELVNQTQSPGT